MRGERPENVSYPGAAEPLQRVWIALRANERAVLETVTLADIVSGELPAGGRRAHRQPAGLGVSSPERTSANHGLNRDAAGGTRGVPPAASTG